MRRRLLGAGSALLVGVVLTACGASSPPSSTGVKPTRIIPTTPALLGGGLPQPDGSLWLLAGGSTDKTLQEINLVSGHVETVAPVEGMARAIAQSPDGILAVGDDDKAGTVNFRDPTSGAVTSTVTVGAPVRAIAPDGASGRFYVLDTTSSVTTVNVVQAGTPNVLGAIGVALDATAIAASPDGSELYVATASGQVSVVPTTGSKLATATFPIGATAVAAALSGDGATLFVLSGTPGVVMTVDVVNVATEHRSAVLPAPTGAVALVPSLDGTQLYVLVGTPSVGNLQVLSVGR